MRRLRTVLGLVLFVQLASGCGVRFVIDAVPAVDELTETQVATDGAIGRDKIAMIDVTGLISDSPRRGLLSGGDNPVSRLVESLAKAEADRRVRAVIIRVNSPGGTVTASDIMYREVMDFRMRTKKPVVVLMADVAASGGYYLACAADRVVAHPTTITGSIGVIIQTFNFSEGMHKIGIAADAITSGPNKSVGSPFEPMSDEHRALLQGLVDEFYAGFVGVVEASRPTLSPADIAWITDGRVVTGQRAAEIGLVDEVGDLRTACRAARELAGVENARLVKYHRPVRYVGSPYAAAPMPTTQVNMLQLNLDGSPLGDVGFYYLWDPMVEW